MSIWEITASWAVAATVESEVVASWQVAVGHEDIVGSWAVDTEKDHDLVGSWKVRAFEAEAYNLFVAQPPVTAITPGGGGPVVSVNNSYDYGCRLAVAGDINHNFDEYVLPSAGATNLQKSLSVRQARGNPATIDFEIWDPDAIFGPFGSASGVLDVDTHAAPTTVRRTFKPTFRVGGTTWTTAPEFLLMDSRTKSGPNGTFVSCKGIDFSQLLIESADAAKGSFVSKSGTVWMLSDILAEILTDNGITSYRFEFTDIPILKFTATGGPPLDWIKALLYLIQAEWWFEGRTFVARAPNFLAPPTWTFEDIYQLADFEYSRTRRGIFNELVVNKEEVTSGVVASRTCTGASCLGIQTISWDAQINTAQVYVQSVTRGNLGSWIWRDINGVDIIPLSGLPQPTILSVTPVHELQFVYTPVLGAVGTPQAWPPGVEPSYSIQILGRAYNQDPVFDGFSSQLRLRKADATSQTRFGRKLGRTVNTTNLGRKADVEYLLCRLLDENLRMENMASTTMNVLNPLILPAEILRYKVGRMGFASGKNFICESVTKRHTGRMDVTLSRTNAMS